MSTIEARIEELGFHLPIPPKPAAAYTPVVKYNQFLFTAGQIPYIEGELRYKVLR